MLTNTVRSNKSLSSSLQSAVGPERRKIEAGREDFTEKLTDGS